MYRTVTIKGPLTSSPYFSLPLLKFSFYYQIFQLQCLLFRHAWRRQWYDLPGRLHEVITVA